MLHIPKRWKICFYRPHPLPIVQFVLYDDFLNNIIKKVGDIHVEDATGITIERYELMQSNEQVAEKMK